MYLYLHLYHYALKQICKTWYRNTLEVLSQAQMINVAHSLHSYEILVYWYLYNT